jgi:hypothetical protein
MRSNPKLKFLAIFAGDLIDFHLGIRCDLASFPRFQACFRGKVRNLND